MKSRLLSQWIDRLLADRPVRANSLIITIYGDLIAPHGGTVWLGSLIRLVESFGINARLVRTSVFRLSREKWLVSEQIGRRSYYSLTGVGRRRFEHAYRRIYDDPCLDWQGDWQIVIMPGASLTPAQRDTLRKDLLWEGFAAIAPGVLAHPAVDAEAVTDILQESATHDKVVLLQAKTLGAFGGRALKEMVGECWNLGEVADEYQRFVARFGVVAKALRSAEELDPEQCFVIRTLLMHEFRRVQLRDPQLPRQLLPNDWPGTVAREMCREIYQHCLDGSERHAEAILETANGPLPPPLPEFFTRFDGIAPAPQAA